MSDQLLDQGLVPDFIVRPAIRYLLRQRLREISRGSFAADHDYKTSFIEDISARQSIADVPEKANEQHYEVPTDFILSTLGPRAKYSSCLYETGRETLAEAEEKMLQSYCEKAQLKDGQEVLDLGCGWGSLSLFLAEKYPNSRIVGLSNSTTQKTYIDGVAKEKGLLNLEIITADVNTYDFGGSRHFERILSIEMLEHMKNYKLLLAKVASWLRPASHSLLFIHIFVHITTPYHFLPSDGWMAQNFFSGGTMPSFDLLTYFQEDVTLLKSWYVSGTHYSRTCEDWLKKQDQMKKEALAHLRKDAQAQGSDTEEAVKTFYRFRVFYMACSELFKMDGGQRWGVGHYLFKRKGE